MNSPRVRCSRLFLRAALVLLAILIIPAIAKAGGARFMDSANLLSATERQAIVAQSARYPFEVRVLTSTEKATAEAFESTVRSQIGGPDVVIVGVDPTHRRTSVFCGQSTRIDGGRCKMAGDAGKAHFRDSHWGAGIQSVLESANEAVGTGPGGTVASSPVNPSPSRGRMGLGAVFGMLIVGAIGLIVVVAILAAVFRRRSAPGTMLGQAGPPIGGQYPGGGYPGGGYPGYPPAGGGGGIGSHIAAAGLGGLAGYAVGRAMTDDHHNHSTDPSSNASMGYGDSNSRDWGAGGGTTSWEDGGSSSADSGGSSDWGGDSGGGDFGGGDSGGGGSDW